MNFSEVFVRRPVMTVLLNVAIVAAGVIGFNNIPVSALPSYDTPVINVSASLPGANPETMATSVALPLEKQFQDCAPSAPAAAWARPLLRWNSMKAAILTPPLSTCKQPFCGRSVRCRRT